MNKFGQSPATSLNRGSTVIKEECILFRNDNHGNYKFNDFFSNGDLSLHQDKTSTLISIFNLVGKVVRHHTNEIEIQNIQGKITVIH